MQTTDSANTGPELRQWLRWAFECGEAPASVRAVAETALIACTPDYLLLRPVLLELKRRYSACPQPAEATKSE